MRTIRVEYLTGPEIDLALRLLTPANRLAMEVCIATGLRIGDVLALRTTELRQRFTIREQKTGKVRKVALRKALLEELQAQAGRLWVFEGARDPEKHRTRQAVWKDVKRAARAARIPANAGTHSGRKIYAVDLYGRKGLNAVQAALNHEDPMVTMVYVMADQLRQRRSGTGRKRSKRIDKSA